MAFKAIYLKHGAWNLSEHGVTRLLDAGLSLALLWILDPERFAHFALAQAWVAPWLIVFLSPESVIYRDFSKWKEQGDGSVVGWLRLFRRVCVLKALVALLLSAVLAFTFPAEGLAWSEKAALMVWAFFWVLSPQISGGDREYLRLELCFPQLLAVGIFQRLIFLGGLVVLASDRPYLSYALVSFLAAILSGFLARFFARARMGSIVAAPRAFRELTSVLKGFTLHTHFSGVLSNWITSMDLFFLGIAGTAARTLGIYSFALKLANFSNALPLALANLFGIWVGRKGPEKAFSVSKLPVIVFLFALVCGAQAGVIWFFSPTLISLLSRGRFLAEEFGPLRSQLGWILVGAVLVQTSYLLTGWFSYMGRAAAVLFKISIPWALGSVLIYGAAVMGASTFGVSPSVAAATANALVGILLVILCWVLYGLAFRAKRAEVKHG